MDVSMKNINREKLQEKYNISKNTEKCNKQRCKKKKKFYLQIKDTNVEKVLKSNIIF